MKSIKLFYLGFREGINYFGYNITVILNSFLLLIVYFFGVGISSIIGILFKKKFLDIKISNTKKSYWSNLSLKKKSLKDYYRQF